MRTDTNYIVESGTRDRAFYLIRSNMSLIVMQYTSVRTTKISKIFQSANFFVVFLTMLLSGASVDVEVDAGGTLVKAVLVEVLDLYNLPNLILKITLLKLVAVVE